MTAGLFTGVGLAVLKETQNGDGGWGYHPKSRSRIEPTCWAYCALSSANDSAQVSACSNARRFLLSHQQNEGFWAASPEMKTGNWVTSLASAVLLHEVESEKAALAGISWLCKDYPFDSSPLVRLLGSLRSKTRVSQHNDSYRGWGWTPRTSSWVEPTAFALLALQESRVQLFPAAASERRKLAVALLYDRMCPDGGWNCGNPRVYGVAGQPLVLPTAWALIALHPFPEHECKSQSLAWLENEVPKIESPGSLAVASMCLETYGKKLPAAKFSLHDCSPDSLLQDGIHILAWVCLALNTNRNWPARVGETI